MHISKSVSVLHRQLQRGMKTYQLLSWRNKSHRKITEASAASAAQKHDPNREIR